MGFWRHDSQFNVVSLRKLLKFFGTKLSCGINNESCRQTCPADPAITQCLYCFTRSSAWGHHCSLERCTLVNEMEEMEMISVLVCPNNSIHRDYIPKIMIRVNGTRTRNMRALRLLARRTSKIRYGLQDSIITLQLLAKVQQFLCPRVS